MSRLSHESWIFSLVCWPISLHVKHNLKRSYMPTLSYFCRHFKTPNTCICYRPLSKSCNAWDWPAGSLSKALTEKSLSSRRYVYTWNITEPTTQSKTLMQIIDGTGCSKQCLSSWLCQLEGSGHASKIVVHPWLSKPVFNWGVDCTPQFGSLIKLKSEPHKAEVIFLNVGCRANWTRQTAVAAAG